MSKATAFNSKSICNPVHQIKRKCFLSYFRVVSLEIHAARIKQRESGELVKKSKILGKF